MTPEQIRSYKTDWARRRRAAMSDTERDEFRAYNRAHHEKHKSERLARSREWKAKNKEKLATDRREYWRANSEREVANHKRWKAENPDRYRQIKQSSDRKYYEEHKEQWREYRRAHTDRINRQQRQLRERRRDTFNNNIRIRRQTDPQYAILCRLRSSLRQTLLRASSKKTTSVLKLIGIPIQELVSYIENRFQPGMTWERPWEFHIDHIQPCCTFDLTDPDQQRECFHYTNLQPMWKVENLRKSSLWEGKVHRHPRKNEDSIDV